MVIKVSEEQRDRLLELSQLSKDVSEDYDKVAEIKEAIEWLPSYLREDFQTSDSYKMWENIEEKLWMLAEYIDQEFLPKESQTNINIIEKLHKLDMWPSQSEKINKLLDDLYREQEIAIEDIPL